nr:hypothetical protein Q903MT_gene3638 [Picea sitchensis]
MHIGVETIPHPAIPHPRRVPHGPISPKRATSGRSIQLKDAQMNSTAFGVLISQII